MHWRFWSSISGRGEGVGSNLDGRISKDLNICFKVTFVESNPMPLKVSLRLGESNAIPSMLSYMAS